MHNPAILTQSSNYSIEAIAKISAQALDSITIYVFADVEVNFNRLYSLALQHTRTPLVSISVFPISSIEDINKDDHDFVERDSMLTSVDTAFVQTQARAALGGSFDHLHPGHKILLTRALMTASDEIYIGVTSQAMLGKKKHADLIQDFETRRNAVDVFTASLKKMIHSNVTINLFELVDGL